MTDRPNILLVLYDQLRYDAAADGALCRTPNLDRLRREGTWFAHHYTPAGICSPARASIMTGLYPHTAGVLNNVHGLTAICHDLPDGHPTLGELLAGVGYRTGYVGKWHLGTTRGARDRGWHDVRFPEGEDDPSVAVGLQDYVDSMVYTRPHGEARHRFAVYLKDPVPPLLVPANVAFDHALDLLSLYAGDREPFCLVVAYAEPHHPTILTEEFIDRYDPASLQPWDNFADTLDGKPYAHRANLIHYGVEDFTWDDWATIVARYLSTVTMLDDQLGRLLGEVDRLGVGEQTLIVVTTDHGDMLGSHGQFNKGPSMYDEVYRVPLCVRAPAAVGAPGGRTVDALTSHVDLLPTIAELAGVSLPPRAWPGRSLRPWLAGEAQPEWRTALLAEFHGDEFGLYSQRMLRRGQHKLVYSPNDVAELYDLAADPGELRNLAADPAVADLRIDLERELLQAMRSTADPLAEFAATVLGR